MIRTRGLVAALLVLGCGSSGGDDPEPERSELRIDMRPVHAIGWAGVLEADESELLRGTDVVTFAWGDDYPSALDVSLDRVWSTCGELEGAITLDSVTSQHEQLDVVITGDTAFRLAPTVEGDFAVVVRGTFVADSEVESCVGADAELELVVSVPVRRPVDVAINRPSACDASDRFLIESDAHLAPGLYVQLVDAAGAAFSPRNAASTHPATLTLTADADTLLSLHTPDNGLAALVVSGAAGPVSVFAFDALTDVLEHVAPAAIDVVGVQFELLGNAGGPTQLASGQVYGDDGWARTTASIGIASSGLEVDGQQVCTLPRAEGFVLRSSTPQTCVAYAELGHGVGPYGETIFDATVPVSAEVIASGTCLLQLDAADYSAGQGFSSALSVEIRNAEQLAHIDEGR
jgi:hypothetical protein